MSSAGVHMLPGRIFTSVPSASMTAVRRLCVMSGGTLVARLGGDAELRREAFDVVGARR